MKKLFAMACAFLLLAGCGGKETKHVPSVYSGDISCNVRIEALSEPAVDYILAFSRKDGNDTVEVLSPESIAGIKAEIKQASVGISYEGKYIETLLPAYYGVSPIDVMSAVFNSLRDSTPVRRDESEDCIVLEYADNSQEGNVRHTVKLDKETLAFESGETEAQGQLLLKIECTSFQAYGKK